MMERIETLGVALVPGVMPGKWVDRWKERQAHIPIELTQLSADEKTLAPLHHFSFLRTRGTEKPRIKGAFTIPLYEELPVLVAPKEHMAGLVEEFPVSALAAEEMLDAEHLGYENAIALAGNGAGVCIVPQAVARVYSRKDTVVKALTGENPSEVGLEAVEENNGGLSAREQERLLETTRIWLCFSRHWQDPESGENHPVIEEFVGIVRGRGEHSSRQPSVREREQSTSKKKPRAANPRQGQPGRKKTTHSVNARSRRRRPRT